MKNRKIDNKLTKQIVIEIGLHRLVKMKAVKAGRSIRELVEECLVEYLDREIDEK